MALNIENTSGAPLNINDLGITLAIGQIVDLSLIGDPFGVANSANGGDLDALITAPSISVKDPIDGTTALSVADGLAACRAMNETHWRVGTGARIGDISDVSVAGVTDSQVLRYNNGTGNWEAANVNSVGGGLLGLGEWEYENNAGGTPSDKSFRFDNASPASATEIRIDYNNDAGADLTNILQALGPGALIYAQEKEDSTKGFALRTSDAGTDNTTFITFPIDEISLLGTSLTNGEKYTFIVGGVGGAKWQNIQTDSGVVSPSEDTDTLNLLGGTGIATSGVDASDTVTITLSASIDDLNDVDTTTTSPSLNDVLTWTGSEWEPAAVTGGIDRVQIVFVGKHGSDSNSGLRPALAKLTIGAAITTASGLTPSTSNRITVKVLDSGTYTESFTVPSWVFLEAHDATIEGTVTLTDDSEVVAREIIKTTSGIAVSKPAGTGAAYVSADVVRADGTADAFVNGAVSSIMIIHARQVFVEDGTAILDNSSGPGHIHMDIEDLYVSGTGTGIDRASNTGAVQGRVSHILDIGAGTGTGIDITTGNVNLNVGTIDITTAWNVAGAGSLNMFVNEIVSGTKTQTSGAATVNVIEAQYPRWLPVENADSPFLADRFGFYSIDTTAGAVTLELPTPASDGDNISFQDVAKNFGTNNFTVDGNGATIDGVATQVLDVDGGSGIVIYSDALGEWSLKRIQEEVGFSPSNVIYVTKNGNDITGTGSFSNPFLTVAKGVSVANAQATAVAPATVKVLDGVFDEVNPINVTNEYVNVQGDQEFSVIIRPTVPASDLFVLTSGTPTLGPSISRCTLQGTAAFKTAGSSLVRTDDDGRFVLDKVNLFDGGIGVEAGVGTISTGQETVWDFATALNCTTAVDVSQTGKMAMQVVFLRGNDTGIAARGSAEVEVGNFAIQNDEGFAESGTGVDMEGSSTIRAISGQVRNCVTGLEANDTTLSNFASVYFFRNTNDFNQVDATAEILITSGSLEKDSLLIADGDLLALNYLETDSDDFIIGSANTTATPGLEFRVRQADGRVFIGDNATNANAPTNTVGGSRTINLIDTNGNLRVWRWQGDPGLHPAFEWLKGINTFAADDEGDAPIVSITAATDTIVIDLSGADYNDPLDPGFPGADRTTLDTRVFFPGAEIRINGTASNDGDYVVSSSTYNSGPETISVVVTTDITVDEGAVGTAVFGGGAGRPDGVSTYVGDPAAAITAGVGDVHWDMLLRETDHFVIRRRTGGAGKEHVRVFQDRTEFQHGPTYDGSDNTVALIVEGIVGLTEGVDNEYLTIRNAISGPGTGPEIEATGPGAEIAIEMIPKGTGTVTVPAGYEANVVAESLINKAYADAAFATSAVRFDARRLENPINADWAVNALAPATPDSNNAGVIVRRFDDTTDEGVGFSLEIPATATSLTIRFKSRAETAPGGAVTANLDLYRRQFPDDAAVTAWSGALALTAIDLPTNENWQYDEQTITLATLGLTAGQWTQFELVRNGGTLSGDWTLARLEVEFS